MSDKLAMTGVPEESHVMVAWRKYKATDDFKCTLQSASRQQYRVGSLWAAFVKGYDAAMNAIAATEAFHLVAIARAANGWRLECECGWADWQETESEANRAKAEHAKAVQS